MAPMTAISAVSWGWAVALAAGCPHDRFVDDFSEISSLIS